MSKLTELAARIAPAIGDGWAAANGIMWTYTDTARLFGPDDQRLFLQRDGDRIEVSGDLPDGWIGHAPSSSSGIRNARITVSATKTPERIAADITRRVLPAYRAYLSATRERKADADAHDALIVSQGESMIRAAGTYAVQWSRIHGRDKDIPTELRIGDYRDGVRGDARLLGDSVQFDRLTMSHADAVELMRWLSRRT